MIRKITLFIISSLIFISTSIANPDWLGLRVFGIHDGNKSVIQNNSILFSGDSFAAEITPAVDLYTYAFYIDPLGEVSLLRSANVADRKGVSVSLSGDGYGYELDNTTGIDTLVVVGSLDKRKTSVIEKIINTQDLSALSNKRTAIRVVNIKHEDRSILTRGIKYIKLDSDQFNEIKITDIPQDTLASILKNISIMSEEVGDKLIESAIVMASTPPGKTRSQKDADLNKKVTKSVVYIKTPTNKEGKYYSGTGFVINKEGDIITNYHVIKKDGEVVKEGGVLNGYSEVKVAFEPKRGANKLKFWPAKIVKVRPTADLAMLRLIERPKNLIPLEFSNNDDIEKGHDAHAIGHPEHGANWTYTKGLIGQLKFDYYHSLGPAFGKQHVKMMIQTSTPIYRGNSGGPLFNHEGKLIGVNTQMPQTRTTFTLKDFDDALESEKQEINNGIKLKVDGYDSVNEAVSVGDVKDFIKQKGNTPIATNEVYAKKYAPEFDDGSVMVERTREENIIDIWVDKDKDGHFEMMVREDLRNEDNRVYYHLDKDNNLIKLSLDRNDNGVVDAWVHYNKGEIKWISYDEDEDGKADRYDKM